LAVVVAVLDAAAGEGVVEAEAGAKLFEVAFLFQVVSRSRKEAS
jgi:hypothetical protein